MKTVDSKKISTKELVCAFILVVSLQAIGGALISTFPIATNAAPRQSSSLNSTLSQQLVVGIYVENQGRGPNASIGIYTVGDQIKFYIYLSQNCSLRLGLVTPDGSVQLKMAGPGNAGTFVDYVEAQYPIGE